MRPLQKGSVHRVLLQQCRDFRVEGTHIDVSVVMESSLKLRFRCTDGSERQVEALPSELISDLKCRAFEAEMGLGMEVCCFYQGRSLRDDTTAEQNSKC